MANDGTTEMIEAEQNHSEQFVNLDSKISQIVDYFRDNPKSINEPASAIAEKIGVPLEFVENVQVGLRGPVEQESSFERFGKIFWRIKNQAQTIFEFLSQGVLKFLRSITERPFWAILISGLVLMSIFVIQRFFPNGSRFSNQTFFAISIAMLLTTLSLHVVCFFRHGRARYPVFAGALLAIGIVLVGMIESFNLGSQIVLILISGVLVGTLYALLGTGMSVVGGFVALRREVRREKRLSRQELVGRLLEVQQAIQGLQSSDLTRSTKGTLLERTRNMKWFPILGVAFGFFSGIFEVAVVGTYSSLTGGFSWDDEVAMSHPAAMVIMVTTFFVGLVVMAGVGYLGGRPLRSLFAVLMSWLGTGIAYLFPYPPYGWEYAINTFQSERFWNGLPFVIAIGVFSGFAASIDTSYWRKRRLKGNDAAQLVSEMVLLQWRLNLGNRQACVMSVDVAGSTRLKADNDPLRIEYSFREYQNLVDEVSQRHGGYVFSTAGDGAIVAFPGSHVALDAARDIHSEMRDFNRKRNRLDKKFRIRIGMHTGETSADFGDAPFSELIDIAAHIEKVAPVGGIAVSDSTARELPEAELVELANSIDGKAVFIVQDPIGDL